MPEEVQVQTTEEAPQESMVPISEGVTTGNDSADDNFLDKIMGSLEPDESDNTLSDSHESLREDDELPQEEMSNHEVADATEVDSQSSEDDSGKPAELDSDDYAKAIAALQRDGVPRSVIDQMADENPQSIVDWGLKRAKVQSDVDSYGAKVKELEEKLSSNNESDDSKKESVATDQPSNAVEAMNRYESEISEVFGDEAAKSVMSPIRDLVEETSQVLTQQHQMMQQIYSVMERQAIDQSRGRLGERFSRLNDDEAFTEVVEQMGKLAQVGEYENLDDLMTDAYRLKFAAVAEKDAMQQQQRSLREAGQPTATTQTSRPAMSKTVQDREDDVLDALLSGKGFDGASAAYNG